MRISFKSRTRTSIFEFMKLFSFILHSSSCDVVRVFVNGPEDLGSIPDRVIPKTLKMVLDTSLLNTL